MDDDPIYKESHRMRFDADNHGVRLVNFRSNGAMKSQDCVTTLFTKNTKISMRPPPCFGGQKSLSPETGEVKFINRDPAT